MLEVIKHVKLFLFCVNLQGFSGVWRADGSFVSSYQAGPCALEISPIPSTSEILSFSKYNVAIDGSAPERKAGRRSEGSPNANF